MDSRFQRSDVLQFGCIMYGDRGLKNIGSLNKNGLAVIIYAYAAA